MKIIQQESQLIFKFNSSTNTVIFLVIAFITGLVLFLPESYSLRNLFDSFKEKMHFNKLLIFIIVYIGLGFISIYLKGINSCSFNKKDHILVIEYKNLLGLRSYCIINYRDIKGIKFEKNYNYDAIKKFDLIINAKKDIIIYHGKSEEEMIALVRIIEPYLIQPGTAPRLRE